MCLCRRIFYTIAKNDSPLSVCKIYTTPTIHTESIKSTTMILITVCWELILFSSFFLKSHAERESESNCQRERREYYYIYVKNVRTIYSLFLWVHEYTQFRFIQEIYPPGWYHMIGWYIYRPVHICPDVLKKSLIYSTYIYSTVHICIYTVYVLYIVYPATFLPPWAG